MKKITAKHITDNLRALARGERIEYRGKLYWFAPDLVPVGAEYKNDLDNGTIYYLDEDDRITGRINGREYGKLIDGVPYKF